MHNLERHVKSSKYPNITNNDYNKNRGIYSFYYYIPTIDMHEFSLRKRIYRGDISYFIPTN